MALTILKPFTDLRFLGITAFILAGFIIKGSIPETNSPGSCSSSGHFDVDGSCAPCYVGQCCTEKAKGIPEFITLTGHRKRDEITLTNDDLVSGKVFYTVKADDDDRTEACDVKHTDCPCGDVIFSIEDDLGLFDLNMKTGDLSIPDVSKLKNQQYYLTIIAENVDHSASNKLELKVYSTIGEANDAFNVGADSGYDNEEEHHRSKRAASAQANVTYDLIKKPPHTNKTDMKVGQMIAFRLTITFPAESTNMLVELFTPDNETILMMLCGVSVVSIGSNLNTDNPGTPELHSIENNLYHDRAVLDFGNVTNSGAGSAPADSQIVIDYEAVMLDRNCANGSTHWVSAGAEYNFEADVWVGQASFECIIDAQETFSNVPEVNFTGPSTMSIGSSAVFTVDLYIPYPAVSLSFDAFAPLNHSNVMSICAVSGKDVAVNYECGFDVNANTHQLFQEGNIKGNARGHLTLGTAINKGAREADNDVASNRITVQFVAHLFDDPAFVGVDFWVGAAAEIGSNQIYAGQLKVTGAAKVTGASPSVTFPAPALKTPGEKTSEIKPVIIEGSVTIPQGSTADYKLEVTAPTNAGGDALLQICGVSLESAGSHLPCVDTDLEPIYTASKEGGMIDSAMLVIGSVTNTGDWGANSSADADVLNYRVLVKATNFSSGAHDITFGFYVNDVRLTPQTVNVDWEAAGAVPEVANASVPQMKMEYKVGGEYVQVGAASRISLDITTSRDVLLPVMDIEFIMPNDTGNDGHSPITICRTEVVSVGKNLPCATKSVVNKKITYDHKYVEGLNDRAILSMGSLCNYEVVNDTAEDVLSLETVVQLHPHSDMTQGKQQWLSGGVMFSDKMMWVGQLALMVLDNETLTVSQVPYIEVVANTSSDTPVGYSAVHTLVIKTGPGDHAPYTVNVSTTAAELTICNVRVLAKGYNLPCVREDVTNELSKDGSGRNIKASIDLGVVSNVGTGSIVTNGVFDDNTLMVEIVVQLSRTAADNTDFTYDVLTTYGGASDTKTVTIHSTLDTSGVDTSVNASSTIDMGVLPITNTDNSSDVNKGQAKRLFLDVFVPIGVTQDLTAKVLAPIAQSSVVEIKYIGILEVGENLPCLHRDQTVPDYINRTTTYPSNFAIASLALGYVCNVGVNKVDENANRIRIEAIVRVLKNDTLVVGSTITLSGSLNTNNERIAIVQRDLTVVDSFTDILPENMTLLNDTAIKLNITDDPIVMSVNEEKTIPFHIIVPPFITAIIKFDVDLPVNDSAVLTFKDLKVTGSGINLAGYGTQLNEMTLTEKSTQNTSQINKVYADLSIVTNAGSTHRIDNANYDDDVINMELTVAMADSAANENGSTHWISLGVKIGIYIVILEHKVMVIRDGLEKPCIEFTGDVDDVTSTDTKVVINGLLRHSNESRAESTNMTAFVLFPPFLQFQAITSINDTYMTCNESHDPNMIQLMCDRFFFTDVVAFTAVLEQKPNYKVPTDIIGKDAVITLATASQMHARAVTQYGSQVDFSCNMNYVNHTVSVTPKAASNCVNVAFGMDDPLKIKDCQISGSPDHYADGTPLNGRKGGTGFSPFVRVGTLSKQRYFQVYFGNKAFVQQITINEGTGFGSKVEKIQPFFSNDGYAWMPGTELDVSQPFPVTVSVSGGMEARYIRVYITKDSNEGKRIGVTFEFHGCYITTDVVGDDLCLGVKEEGVVNTDWHRSGFLNDGSNLYVCDAKAEDGLKQACYKTSTGDNWEKLDERLGCMVGAAEGNLYALANDGLTYMSSSDNGQSWASVRKERFDEASAHGSFKAPKKMKWEENSALQNTVPDASHIDGEWGATFAGIRKNNGGTWPVKFNWASCCGK